MTKRPKYAKDRCQRRTYTTFIIKLIFISSYFFQKNFFFQLFRQRDRLEDLIRHLTPERSKIGDCMVFCIEHADAADEICECIEESMSSLQTLISKKVARLYLVSDILHNCTVKVSNASFYRTS